MRGVVEARGKLQILCLINFAKRFGSKLHHTVDGPATCHAPLCLFGAASTIIGSFPGEQERPILFYLLE